MNCYPKPEPKTSDIDTPRCSGDQLAVEVEQLKKIIAGHDRQLSILIRAIIGPIPDRTKLTIDIDKKRVTALCRRLNQAAEHQRALFDDEEVIQR